ncbi:hypothetical protein NY78_0775 [Desulfovibrio sp. TomC]|nr:hypothetical protein NY78_0775 [Desulfovibrio sp. TomC]
MIVALPVFPSIPVSIFPKLAEIAVEDAAHITEQSRRRPHFLFFWGFFF